jgi:bacteriocin-like protein
MNNELTTLSNEDLASVTGGGWKGKLAKGAWEAAKWTGIPSAIGAGAAWVQRQIEGPRPPAPSNPPTSTNPQ